jgi:xanthine dehydrogenase large subunit
MSLPHDSAHTHVTGKSEFIDDRIPLKNELFMDVFYSTRAHAEILSIDVSEALKEPEVKAILSAKDLAHNLWGTIFKDQPLLADKVVEFAGEPILLVIATSSRAAALAKKKIKINYKDLPKIMTITEAKNKKSFIGEARFIERGNIAEAFKTATHILQGEIKIQGHDHFYLESQAAIAYPLEDNQIEVHSSSQHPTETQHVTAHALGLKESDVVVIVKRMGGGFGGKESQAAPIAAMCALGAQKLNFPMRLVLTKDDDMIMTGKRNPFENIFKVAFDGEGKITALDVELYSDAGAYADLSTAIMERAMLHCDNAYFIPHIKVRGQVCKTHHHPHTAFRGFGGPKGVATIELIIEKIAHHLKLDPLEVRLKNLYRDSDGKNITHYGQVFKNNCLPRLFEKSIKDFDYKKRREEIVKYNKSQDHYLRGLSLTPVKFGISFTTRFLNQGNALVIIHQDGSLQVSTGATEMGQGVNARIAEVVSTELGLKRSDVRLMPTRTDKNANTSPTAASTGTDINGAAAVMAVRKIKRRLSKLALQLLALPKEKWAAKTAGLGTQAEISVDDYYPETTLSLYEMHAIYDDIIFKNGFAYKSQEPQNKITFKELCLEAYLNRVSLSDYAFYKIPGIQFDKLKGQGTPFLYFTQGVCLSQVKINRDSGEVKVESAEILMDLGRPINEDLDIGQVAGAFVQGMGWVTTENLFYNEEGLLLSHAPSTYKIPSIQDTPRKFTIKLLDNGENYANLRGTKAVGEPPLLLAISVWTAIQNALTSLPQYDKNYPELKIPATNEEVLKAIYPNLNL